MGGRGGKSSLKTGLRHTGIDITVDGKTTRYYFSSNEGNNFYQRGLENRLQPTPQNKTASDFIEGAKKNGAIVKILTSAQKKADLERYEKHRKEINEVLNEAYARDKMFVKGSRMERIGNRVQKRRK